MLKKLILLLFLGSLSFTILSVQAWITFSHHLTIYLNEETSHYLVDLLIYQEDVQPVSDTVISELILPEYQNFYQLNMNGVQVEEGYVSARLHGHDRNITFFTYSPNQKISYNTSISFVEALDKPYKVILVSSQGIAYQSDFINHEPVSLSMRSTKFSGVIGLEIFEPTFLIPGDTLNNTPNESLPRWAAAIIYVVFLLLVKVIFLFLFRIGFQKETPKLLGIQVFYSSIFAFIALYLEFLSFPIGQYLFALLISIFVMVDLFASIQWINRLSIARRTLLSLASSPIMIFGLFFLLAW